MTAHLAVPCGENSSQVLPVLFHLVKLPLQGALHVGIGQHVFYYIFLQHPPQRPLVGTVKLKPGQIRQIIIKTLKNISVFTKISE